MSTLDSAHEEARIRQDIQAGRKPGCPRCGSPLRSSEIPPRSDVAYVRQRILLDCGSCSFRAVVDAPASENEDR